MNAINTNHPDSGSEPPPSPERTVVIGAGPAGLTAAWELAKLGVPGIVFEADDTVGGIARTASYRGYRFDIGGHRFFTKVPIVWDAWREMLDEEFLERPRLSRIYYQGKFFDYPIRPLNALTQLGLVESARVAISWGWAQAFPQRPETSFDQWVSNRFGRRLFEIFFKTYTEKVWGIPCHEIGADWAAQRIKNLDLMTALKNALLPTPKQGDSVVTTLIDRFHYPRLGPGQVWEQCTDKLNAADLPVRLGQRVERVYHRDGRVVAVGVAAADGTLGSARVEADHVISSMALPHLIRALDPPPPRAVRAAADRLRFRDFLTVVLIVDRAEVFPDNWIYIHAPEVRLGRIQNFKNWSPSMVPDPSKTALGLEYFVQEGDDLWSASDAALGALGSRELATLGLVDEDEVIDTTVVRMPRAYPVYDPEYRDAVATIRGYLAGLPNLYPIGRNGQHRYNNQDHSMVTGILAARNVMGADHDIWSVNVEQAYHEEVRDGEPEAQGGAQQGATEVTAAATAVAGGDRLVPRRLEPDARLSELFARYDPVALGGAIGVLASGGLFVATAVLLRQGGEPRGPTLGLLGQFLFGYQVSWGGAVVGLLEAGVLGFVFGFLLAHLINVVVGWVEGGLRRDLALTRVLGQSAGDLES